MSRRSRVRLATSLTTLGMLTAALAVIIVMVVLLGRLPDENERSLAVLTVAAIAASFLVAPSLHARVSRWADRHADADHHDVGSVLTTFTARMSRAVPLDELLRQLAELLRAQLGLSVAEVWTGDGTHFARTLSVPTLPPLTADISPDALAALGSAGVRGNTWLQLWVPQLLSEVDREHVRIVPAQHLGQVLGLVVLRTPRDRPAPSAADERAVEDVARQLGVMLHNARLDAALQHTVDELRERNVELVASRARIVAAGDESRRRIERDLHDGAQQRLVGLAVKLGVIRSDLEAGDLERIESLVEELDDEVKGAVAELRELAQGVYPPRLRDRGLADALRSAVTNRSIPATVTAEGLGRYSPGVEAAVYFCCVEAIQNAVKHAGERARLTIALREAGGQLSFEVTDDGRGFDPSDPLHGQGLTNMEDRIGAVEGVVVIDGRPGGGTTVRGSVPVVTTAARPGRSEPPSHADASSSPP